MTLPSRRKHQTTVQNTDLAKAVRHWLRTSLLLSGCAATAIGLASKAQAQTGWQPSRIPQNANATHISQYEAVSHTQPTLDRRGSQSWSPQRPAVGSQSSSRTAAGTPSSSNAARGRISDSSVPTVASPNSESSRTRVRFADEMQQEDLPPLRWESPQSASTANFQRQSPNQHPSPSQRDRKVAKVQAADTASSMRTFTADDAFSSEGRRAQIFRGSHGSETQAAHSQVARAQAVRQRAAVQSHVQPANHQQSLPQDPFGGQLGFPSGGPEEVSPQPADSLPNQFAPRGQDSTLQMEDPPSMSPFGNNPSSQPEIGGMQSDPGAFPDRAPDLDSFGDDSLSDSDPMESPEPAALPPGATEDPSQSDVRSNPFDDDRGAFEGEGFKGGSDQGPELIPSPREEDEEDDDLDLPDRNDSSAISCNELRDRIRSRPLNNVSLDVSPSYGEGLRSVKKDTESEKLEFAARSVVRDWHDYKGVHLIAGRLIDLKNDRAIIDVHGVERSIPLMDLSDLDLSYIGDVWNIPLKCGTGNERYDGRAFIPSTVQWKAPGHCHKPLYFEQPQLERYGHEAGPIVQPLLSTAHFFANIAVLPYKAGIHPPNECQYSLGYYRPGNCAPYMVQPIPLSLKGAISQAGFVVGASALIP